jgi:hypothetical protein
VIALGTILLLVAVQTGDPLSGGSGLDSPTPRSSAYRFAEQDASLSEPLWVSCTLEEGVLWWTVRAKQIPLDRFLGAIASKGGYTVEGLGQIATMPLITLDLRLRRLEQVLEYALGSVGLRHDLRRDTISLVADGEEPDADLLLNLASVAWLNATSRFPDNPSAPIARLAQGEIAEMRRNPGAALNHYLTLIESYPRSDSVVEAHMRCGRILQRMKRWSEASEQYKNIARIEEATAYQPLARLEVARCSVNLGDPQSAIYILGALESSYPTNDPIETAGRVLVHSQALNAQGRHMEALRDLDAAGPRLDSIANAEAARVRAISLEGLKLYGDASQAWLIHSRSASPAEQEEALREAARLALLAKDELAVLFICKEAAKIPPVRSFEEFEREARRRLGFEAEAEPRDSTVSDRITLAEEWLERGDLQRAAEVFESLFLARGALATEEETARVSVGWAKCVEQREDLERALQILAESRGGLETLPARGILDIAAASLLEKHELFDRAIEAYRGAY